MRRNHAQFGLTMIEITVVVAITGVLAAATIVTLVGLETRVKHKAAVDLLMTLDVALAEYHEVVGDYPDPNDLKNTVQAETTVSEQLWLMLEQVDSSAQVLERIHTKYTRDREDDVTYRSVIDPWGLEIDYEYSEDYPILRSAGPNRRFDDPNDMSDDITNLEGQS